jgi:hypothetical protein
MSVLGPEMLKLIGAIEVVCELTTSGLEVMTRGLELATCGVELMTGGFELITTIATDELEACPARAELVLRRIEVEATDETTATPDPDVMCLAPHTPLL